MGKKICSILFLCLWMGLIFQFSAQPAKESSALSSSVKQKVIEVVKKVFPEFKADAQIAPGVSAALTTIIRKSAHFGLYLILGILALWTCQSFGLQWRPSLCAFLFCVLYAISDEVHQCFVSGRAGRVLDVCIYAAGAHIGIFLLNTLYKITKKA